MSNQTPIVKIKADSISAYSNKRCTTFLLENFPYRLIQEPSTHRLIKWGSTYEQFGLGDTNPFTEHVSRNSASTRAIPVRKLVDKILENPYIPTFTRNQPGMQGNDNLTQDEVNDLTDLYLNSMHTQLNFALWMGEKNAHKQEINGILSPYMRIPILCTATEWNNFFNLRNHSAVHPDLHEFAKEMQTLYNSNYSNAKVIEIDDYHLPYYTDDLSSYSKLNILKICTARNARLSYYKFDGEYKPEDDIKIYDEKLLSDPLHGSPFEHNLKVTDTDQNYANFTGGWISTRKILEGLNHV